MQTTKVSPVDKYVFIPATVIITIYMVIVIAFPHFHNQHIHQTFVGVDNKVDYFLHTLAQC